ncbi:hypothetical protein SK128_008438, partial [Halocaridina rubra]
MITIIIALQGSDLARRAWQSLSKSLAAACLTAGTSSSSSSSLPPPPTRFSLATTSSTPFSSTSSSSASSSARQQQQMQGNATLFPVASTGVSPPDRPHSCPLCPYRATTRDSLARHIRTHTGERPFKCSFCPYRAIQKSDVDKHIKRRHKESLHLWPATTATSSSPLASLMSASSAVTSWPVSLPSEERRGENEL